MKQRKALLLVNVGTPDSPKKGAVRKFLSEFLNDRRVIDIPLILQKILVNLIIVPFRVSKSSKLYQKLWTKDGSPLLIYMNSLVKKLQNLIGNETDVFGAMRYGNPSISDVLNQIKKENYDHLLILPLFPQYASSTSGSIIEKTMKQINSWEVIPDIHVVGQFYNHPAFIDLFAYKIMETKPANYDHIIFSYHGLPLRQINKVHPHIDCENCTCENETPAHGTQCYKATCYATTTLLNNKLNIPVDSMSVAFQSRFSKNWLSPFTDEIIIDLANKRMKNILVVAPSFVADCLETIVEIEQDYNELFRKHGGEQLTLVSSLNDDDSWAAGILEIVKLNH